MKVKTNIVAHIDIFEVTRLVANDWCDVTIDMANSNDEANINSANVDLIEFGVYSKTLLVDNILETRYK